MYRPPSQRTAPPPRIDRRRYDRARDLPSLLPMWPSEITDASVAGRERLIARLRSALRAERARGLAGHWTYDLARHAQLRTALEAELADLDADGPSPRTTANACKKARS